MANPYQEAIAAAFEDELQKIAQEKAAKISPATMKMLGLMGAGAIGYETVRRANQDRRIGRTMRMQQSY